MAKIPRNYRISEEVDALIKAEAERMSGETARKVSEADVIEMAMVRWCSVGVAENGLSNEGENSAIEGVSDRRGAAEAAMRGAESVSAPVPTVQKVNPRAESVAQRKARETKEHAEALAKSDYLAQVTGRDDIDYDLENVPHRPVGMPVPVSADGSEPKPIIQREPTYKRSFKPLARPHGGVEAKRKRDQ